jgi:hypothetical protein
MERGVGREIETGERWHRRDVGALVIPLQARYLGVAES